jgi:predicted secreted protein
MTPLTYAAIYIMIWCVSLFVVLPFGSRTSHHEAGLKTTDGGDPGAPLVTDLKRKLLVNTGVAAAIWLIFVIIVTLHLITI